ncbi:MAG TPA: exodeoxyribonuclease VII small subunit [Thermoplasmata archaeon]|nr:exodeoxyribonuclease VII small subunit [Thermoplasmata archaeon]
MTEPKSFEDALAALEAKVEELARGDVPLDRALAAFEEGLALYRTCHEMLDRAEQRVTKLVAATDGLKEEPFPVP